MGRTTYVATPTLKVPSRDPLAYCRLCFSTSLCKKITTPKEAAKWIDVIQTTVGIQMIIEVDVPFAICFGCRATLQSVEQFRVTCRLHDTVLRQFRSDSGKVDAANVTAESVSTGHGECSTVSMDSMTPTIGPETEESVNIAIESSNSPKVDTMCFVCNKQLSSPREYKKHMKKVHHRVKGIVTCPYCPRRFRKMILFQQHVMEHSKIPTTNPATQSKHEKCYLCNLLFESSQALEKHENDVHNLSLKCRLCDLQFCNQQEIRVHKLMHLADPNKRLKTHFKCKICLRVFPNRHYQFVHVKKHEKFFMCIVCGNKFSRVEEYVDHQTMDHQFDTTLNECFECNMNFTSRERVLHHLSTKHATYARFNVDNDECSDPEKALENGAGHSGNSQPAEIETVSLSSDDDSDVDNDDDGIGQGEHKVVTKENDFTNRLEEELMLEEVPPHSVFDLYGTAFRPQISESMIEELSD